MDALDLGVISGSMNPREADFHAQCKEPQMQASRKGRRCGGVEKDGAPIEGNLAWQASGKKRPP